MTHVMRLIPLILLTLLAPRGAAAQMGEIHVGLVGSYGRAESFGRGMGVVVGVAPGRLAYAGLRWIRYSRQSQIFAFDMGMLIPARNVEIVPGVSVGSTSFTHDGEFTVAPGLAIHLPVGHLLLIPEMQYVIAGAPQSVPGTTHRGAVASVRFVYKREIRPIRH